MKSKELKAAVEVLQELSSTCDETVNILNEAIQEAHYARSLLGKHMSEKENTGLVKLGLNIMHFPGLIPSIFLNELFQYKIIGVSLVAAGLIQEKRSPLQAVDVYENFQETVHKLHKTIDETI